MILKKILKWTLFFKMLVPDTPLETVKMACGKCFASILIGMLSVAFAGINWACGLSFCVSAGLLIDQLIEISRSFEHYKRAHFA